MSEPISAAIGLVSYGALIGMARQNTSALSAEAALVWRETIEIARSVETSRALFGEKSAAIARLADLAADCSEAGWDGDDAMPLNPVAVIRAQDLIRILPEDVPMPSFAAEPDGSVSVDWMVSPFQLLSVSVSATDRLAFAWLDGTDRGHGAARFDGDEVPRHLLSAIREVVSHDVTAIRAA